MPPACRNVRTIATRLVQAVVGLAYLGAGRLNKVCREIRGGATTWLGGSIVRVLSSKQGCSGFDEQRGSFVLDKLAFIWVGCGVRTEVNEPMPMITGTPKRLG